MIRRATSVDWSGIESIEAGASRWTEYGAWVIETGAAVAGFLVTREVADGEFEILEIAVASAWRGRGFATRLIRHALNERPGVYFLEVRAANDIARSLYRGLGFEEVGIRPAYYSEPEESAVVMRIRSC